MVHSVKAIGKKGPKSNKIFTKTNVFNEVLFKKETKSFLFHWLLFQTLTKVCENIMFRYSSQVKMSVTSDVNSSCKRTLEDII